MPHIIWRSSRLACRCWLSLVATGLVATSLSAPLARAGSTTFVVIGDYGANNADEGRVAAMVTSWDPDFVITVGDNTYGDANINVQSWEQHVGQYYGHFIQGRSDRRYPSQTSATQRFFPSVGNHDVANPIADATELPSGPPYYTGSINAIRPGYLDYFHFDPGNVNGRLPAGHHELSRTYYDFRWGDAHLFALDSDSAFFDPESAEEQANWLQAKMGESDAAWKFVYFHHPPYSSGSHGDQEHMQWPFAEWGASAILTGHDHTFERILRNGLPYFVNGLGAQVEYGFFNITEGSVVRYNENHGDGALLWTSGRRDSSFWP